MRILYITFIDFAISSSGSSVRPHKMYDAFVENGNEVFLVKGDDFISHDNSEHKKSLEDANRWLDSNRPDICYVENATHPLFRRGDRNLIKRVHKMGVSIGYFYRDAYYRFPKLFGAGKGLKNKLIYYYTLPLFYRDERFIRKYVDILYFPSQEACDLFPHSDKRPLPPAGENKLPADKIQNNTLIYVGGISEHYGLEVLIDAFDILHDRGKEYKLILVCRKQEWDSVKSKYESLPWLTVKHASGDELGKLYAVAAAAALIPKDNNEYNNMAISVKLFEYMSHGLPVVSTHSDAMDAFIDKYDIGLTTDYDSEKFADAIDLLLSNNEIYQEKRKNTCEALLKGNMWIDRAKQICEDLSTVHS